jgi:hypothetical protein
MHDFGTGATCGPKVRELQYCKRPADLWGLPHRIVALDPFVVYSWDSS